MSPLPSPMPLRRRLLRTLFSPGGLLFGFVVLIVATCPGARGGDAIEQLILNSGLDVQVLTAAPSADGRSVASSATSDRVIGRSTRFDRVPGSSARSKTPAERAAAMRATPGSDTDRQPRPVLPLYSAELQGEAARASASGLVPMTGPTVGIRSPLPRAGR